MCTRRSRGCEEPQDMKSPFPGMDPYIEGQDLWSDFHGDFLIAARAALVSRVRPAYEVRAERYVFLCDEEGEHLKGVQPDIHVADAGHGWREYAGTMVATAIEPIH